MKQFTSSNSSNGSFLSDNNFTQSLLQWEFSTLFSLSLFLDLIKLYLHNKLYLHSSHSYITTTINESTMHKPPARMVAPSNKQINKVIHVQSF